MFVHREIWHPNVALKPHALCLHLLTQDVCLNLSNIVGKPYIICGYDVVQVGGALVVGCSQAGLIGQGEGCGPLRVIRQVRSGEVRGVLRNTGACPSSWVTRPPGQPPHLPCPARPCMASSCRHMVNALLTAAQPDFAGTQPEPVAQPATYE